MEVMTRKASDNKYLHRDFHNLLNLGLEYLRAEYGEQAVLDYLRQFTNSYYAPLKRQLLTKGLEAIARRHRQVFEAEEAEDLLEIRLMEEELLVRVIRSPAVEHLLHSRLTPSPMQVETLRTVHTELCRDTPYAYELLSYEPSTGASLERFYKRGEKA